MDLADALEIAQHLHRSTDAELLAAEVVLAQSLDRDGNQEAYRPYVSVSGELDMRTRGAKQDARQGGTKVEKLRRELAGAEVKILEVERRIAALGVRAPKPRRRKFYNDGSSSLL